MPAQVDRCELASTTTRHAGLGEIQRARILAAMSEVVVERGAGTVTVADVVDRSGVSRRTFYELFPDREACFVAAFDRALQLAGESVLRAFHSEVGWRERMRAGLRALLVFLDAEPDLGYLCVVGSQAAGPHAVARRNTVAETLVAAVHEGGRGAPRGRRPDRLTAEGLVGAVLAILASRLAPPDRRPLLALLNQLMAMIVLPYLGAAEAERELRRPRRDGRDGGSPPVNGARPRAGALRDLDMRLTYRTVRVLLSISDLSAQGISPSNRQVATAAGIADAGQVSKLLARFQALGLIENIGGDHAKGEPNAWRLTPKGENVTQTLKEAA